MARPGSPFGDPRIASELDAIRARLARLGAESKPEKVATELGAIRETLRKLSEDNEELRKQLGAALGLRIDDDLNT